MARRHAKLAAALIAVLAAAPATRAGDYAFDLPQLVGHYLGDIPAVPTFELSVDLGMPFAEISGATLQLIGSHAPGLYGDLNFPRTFQASAEVVAWLPQQSFSSAYVDKLLPMPAGEFEINAPWRASTPHPFNLTAWKDGTAEFRFQISGPLLIATTYAIQQPAVTINAATLIIHGQPSLDAFMLPGDFNGDGAVDDADLAVWQATTASSGSDFLTWQRNRGATLPRPSQTSVPEPHALALLASVTVLFTLTGRARQPSKLSECKRMS